MNRYFLIFLVAICIFCFLPPSILKSEDTDKSPTLYETISPFKAYKIASGAMMPTLLIGDRVLVKKHFYKNRAPQKGDIIVFVPPHEQLKVYVSRLIGVEGDVIEIRDKHLFINNIDQNESYIINSDERIFPSGFSPRDNFGPFTVPEKQLFFLGDNRDNSFDSRFWGFVSIDKVKGKVVSLYWSWNGDEGKVRWGRIGKSIEKVTN